jgi:hypothetical protein
LSPRAEKKKKKRGKSFRVFFFSASLFFLFTTKVGKDKQKGRAGKEKQVARRRRAER